MKPAPFEYARPTTLDEALEVLAADPDESKILAGGQSLVPIMNFRLGRPERLIDINRLHSALSGIDDHGDTVQVGALTRHRVVEKTTHPGPLGDLLRKAGPLIGHLPIRTRGTFGGSLAHSDAASEWCLVATLLDAQMTVRSKARGVRTIPASEFFQTIFSTSMELDEILLHVDLPTLHSNYHTGVTEFARRAGDFAIVAATSAVRVDDEVVTDARVCLGGVSEVPFRSRAAEQALLGAAWGPASIAAAVAAAKDEVDPPSDSHGDGEFRRDLVGALLTRALEQKPLATSHGEEVERVGV